MKWYYRSVLKLPEKRDANRALGSAVHAEVSDGLRVVGEGRGQVGFGRKPGNDREGHYRTNLLWRSERRRLHRAHLRACRLMTTIVMSAATGARLQRSNEARLDCKSEEDHGQTDQRDQPRYAVRARWNASGHYRVQISTDRQSWYRSQTDFVDFMCGGLKRCYM
jgi:hypothetical protein